MHIGSQIKNKYFNFSTSNLKLKSDCGAATACFPAVDAASCLLLLATAATSLRCLLPLLPLLWVHGATKTEHGEHEGDRTGRVAVFF